MLDRLYCSFDELAEKYSVYKIDTIGDGEQLFVVSARFFDWVQPPNVYTFVLALPNLLISAYVAGTNLIIDQTNNHASSMARFAVDAMQAVFKIQLVNSI